MQQETNTTRPNVLANAQTVLGRLMEQMTHAQRVFITWETSLTTGSIVIDNPLVEHIPAKRRIRIVDAEDVEIEFQCMYGASGLFISDDQQESETDYSVHIATDGLDCWMVCES